MRRRAFITLVGSSAIWSIAARGQQRRVIVLTGEAVTDPENQRHFKAIVDGLAVLGWKPGKDLTIDFRGIGGDVRLVKSYVSDALVSMPDAIVSSSGPILVALEKHTQSVPIVFLEIMDPVAGGFVKSLARPGGNVTGFTNFEPEFGGKWLELLTSIAPKTARVIVILNPDVSPQIHVLESIKKFAESSRIQVTEAGVHSPADIKRVLDQNANLNETGVIVLPNPITIANRVMLIQAVNAARLPAIYPNKYFAESGGLASYGTDTEAQFRLAAGYVDRILRGEKAGNLPVQAPTKFELIVNRKTAKALGLTIPQTLLATADEVIE